MNVIGPRLGRAARLGRSHGMAAGPNAARQVVTWTVTLAACLYDLVLLMLCSAVLYTVLLAVGLLVIALEIWMVLHPLSFCIALVLAVVPAARAYCRRSSPSGRITSQPPH
jgi:hypothetical protein